MEVKKYKLGELLSKIENGAVIKQNKGATGIPITRIETLSNGLFNRGKLGYADIEDPTLYANYVLEDNDLLMSHINSKEFVGRTVIYKKQENECIIHGMNLLRIKTNAKLLDPEFAYYYFQTDTIKRSLYNLRKDAIGQSSIAISDIKNMVVSVPNISIQKEIAFVLRCYDRRIELNRAINQNLEAMAKQLYDYWFVQFDFPDENGKPYKSSGGKMVWNEKLKRKIPENWEVMELKDVVNVNRGISYNSETILGDGVPMINLASFNVDGTYKHSGIKTYNGNYSEDKILKPFDLIMCNTQQTSIDFSKDIIGKAFLVPFIFEGDVVSSHHVTTLIPKQKEMKAYLAYLSNTKHFHKYATGCCSGTNIMGLNYIGLSLYKMEIPPVKLLQQFESMIIQIEKRKGLIILENEMLTKQRDELLPLLMNGQVSVNSDLSDD